MDEYFVSIKVYLIAENETEPEVRRFGILSFHATNLKHLFEKIVEVFPRLNGKLFTLLWKDGDDDEISISSDDDLSIAINEMKSEVKKFYIKVKGSSAESNNAELLHPMVYCDGCNDKIIGFRYKCIACKNYDLCSRCEQASMHSEHPMLRIPNPSFFNRTDLHKVICGLLKSTLFKVEGGKHHSHHRRHSRDNTNPDFCKKKRKCDKHESNPESDESDENGSKKHSHGKLKKINCRVYNQINDFLTILDSALLQTGGATKAEESKKSKTPEEISDDVFHVKFLKSASKLLFSLVDPLGADAYFEIRPKEDKKAEPEQKTKNETSAPSGASTSQQKEVRFATPEKETEIDELVNILLNQKVSESPEKEDWVSFEELKQDSNDSGLKNATAPIEEPAEKKPTVSVSATPQETQNLYPNINSQTLPTNPVIREALEKMLSMGFTNDGDWLTHLLEAKKGDIDQALEVLAPHKNK